MSTSGVGTFLTFIRVTLKIIHTVLSLGLTVFTMVVAGAAVQATVPFPVGLMRVLLATAIDSDFVFAGIPINF